ncbi:hypothetical protein QYM36_018963, partial [Artemia franciscana]
ELEKNKIIRPSIGPYSAPVILVPKKNNDLRLVVDDRALNKQVVSDQFLLPRIDEILDSISNKNKIFTSLDLTQGYHQVKIAEGDVYKTAFSTTECGSYEYLRVPFGLKTSSSALCRPLLHLLRGLNNIIHFVDDVIAMDKDPEDHLVTLAKALEKFREEPILSLPDFQTGQLVVTTGTDASTKRIGAILSRIVNGEERVIAYASRTLTPVESNYSATQLELLSIIHHMDKFRHYLVGRKS